MKNREAAADYNRHLPLRKRSLFGLQSLHQPIRENPSFSCAQHEASATTPPPNQCLSSPEPQEPRAVENNGSSTASIIKPEQQPCTMSAELDTIASCNRQPESSPSSLQHPSPPVHTALLNSVLKRNISPPYEQHPTRRKQPQTFVAKQELPLDGNESSDEDKEDDTKIYCVCKTTYNPNLWMICCDICNEWYHGKCVHVTANEARKIKVYVCPLCKEKDPLLQIEYKSSKKKQHQRAFDDSAVNGGSNNGANKSPCGNGAGGSESSSSSPGEAPFGVPPTVPANIVKLANKKRKKMVITDDDSSQETEPSKRARKPNYENDYLKSSMHTTLSLVEPTEHRTQLPPPLLQKEEHKECTVLQQSVLEKQRSASSPDQVELENNNYVSSQSSRDPAHRSQLYHKLVQQEVPANY